MAYPVGDDAHLNVDTAQTIAAILDRKITGVYLQALDKNVRVRLQGTASATLGSRLIANAPAVFFELQAGQSLSVCGEEAGATVWRQFVV